MIGTVFTHSKKLRAFLDEKKLDEQQAHDVLISN